MDELGREFATGLAATARADIEAAVDHALKKSGTARQNRALANLRQKAVAALERVAAGEGGRWPAAVLDETLSGIRSILRPEADAVVKRASGPGDRNKAPGLRDVQPQEASIKGLEAIAREFRELVELGRKICTTPNTVLPFGRWEQRNRSDLWEALHRGDIEAARAIMSDARDRLSAILDDVKLDRALGEEHPEKAAALVPGWTH
ncbi:MAG: hypothetical protein ACREFP_03135 [Acetobacteraceae bacterium]